MKIASNYNDFTDFIESEKCSFLFLYEDGNKNSDSAFAHLKEAIDQKSHHLALADVNEVRDIHSHYTISTIPTLFEFENGQIKNVVKGCQEEAFYSTIFKDAVLSSNVTSSGNTKRVIVYTWPTCHYYNATKNYLSGQGIAYKESDVSCDKRAAQEMVRRSGQY